MISLKLMFVQTRKTLKKQKGEIIYQITYNKKVRQIHSGLFLLSNEWDTKKSSININNHSSENLMSLHADILADIRRLRFVMSELQEDIINFTIDDVVARFHNYRKQLIINNLMTSKIQKFKVAKRQRTAEAYTSALRSLSRFHIGSELMIDCIDEKFLESYQNYLIEKGLTMNTISFYMRIIRAVYNDAAKAHLITQKFPFRNVYTSIGKTIKRALGIDYIKHIKNLSLPILSCVDFARDLFMFSFYTRGMAFVDIAYLKKDDVKNGILTYCRKKTKQKLCIKWEECMQRIVSKYEDNDTDYLFPIIKNESDARTQYLSYSHKVNRHLKNISRMINAPFVITFYVARHSWASIAKSKGISLSIISEGMGHEREATTQIYLASLDTATIDRANSLIINSI